VRQSPGSPNEMPWSGRCLTSSMIYEWFLWLWGGEPEEIARAVVFLVADEAGASPGATLLTNGGQYMV
jgi:NAD(P)-dependent dehydrogenase (short-subunit alcohol dehydrogenase family)